MNPEFDLYAEDVDGQPLVEELTETSALSSFATVGTFATALTCAGTMSSVSSLG